jgi:hypothetical protein
MNKIRHSKEIAAGGGGTTGVPHAERTVGALPLGEPVSDDEEIAASPPRNVRFSENPASAFPPPPQRTASAVSKTSPTKEIKATALYDFEAQGEDELTIADGEDLIVVEKENDDWWTVKNAQGQQGVVPAQYVEVSTAGPIKYPSLIETLIRAVGYRWIVYTGNSYLRTSCRF